MTERVPGGLEFVAGNGLLHRRFAHAAGSAGRDNHAERAAFRAPPQRRSGYRSRGASSAYPRSGGARAVLRPGGAVPLPDGFGYPVHRVRRQQPLGGIHPEARRRQLRDAARPGFVQRVDRCAVVHSARRSRCRSGSALDPRRGDGCGGDEPQRASGQGHGRCAVGALPERRALASGKRLSGAAVPAGVRGQHERQVAAPHQGHGGAHHDQGRDFQVLRPAAGRSLADVHLPHGSEVGDHLAVTGIDAR